VTTGLLAILQICGQVLVTAESLASPTQYTLAKQTFLELFQLGAVPIVNENVRPALAYISCVLMMAMVATAGMGSGSSSTTSPAGPGCLL
jgi:hypothetical protein